MLPSTRALVIEDDPIYGRLLRLTLESSGYSVTVATSGRAGLDALVRNAGRVLVADDLLRLAWGPGYEGDATLLRTTIRRLRQKLGEPPEGGLIQNVRGVGYVLEAPGND